MPAGAGAVGVKAVCPASLDEFEGRLLASVDQPLADAAVHPEDEIERVRPEAGDLHDFRDARRVQATEAGARLDVFQRCHARHYPLAMNRAPGDRPRTVTSPCPGML